MVLTGESNFHSAQLGLSFSVLPKPAVSLTLMPSAVLVIANGDPVAVRTVVAPANAAPCLISMSRTRAEKPFNAIGVVEPATKKSILSFTL